MDRNIGGNVDMEDRILSGSSRLRSKVPRARFAPKFGNEIPEAPNFECRNGGSQKILASVPCASAPVPHPAPPTVPQLSDTDETKEWKKLLGERVCISGVKQGILRYYGRTNFAQGLWCGVELDEPVGKNNGTVNGVVYFKCKTNHGIFAPISKVSKLNDLSGSQDWQQENLNQTQNLDYNVRYTPEELYHERKFIRTSRSDPTFLMNTVRTVLPHNSESFPYDDRRVMELRDSAHPSKHRSKHTSAMTYNASSPQRPSFNNGEVRTNITSNPLSACLMSRYGSKTQFGSKVVRLSEEDEINAAARGVCRQADFLQRTARAQHRGSIPASSSFSVAKEEYESYFTKTHASSGHMSPATSEGKSYSGMQLIGECNRLSPEKLSNNYLRDYRHEDDFMLVEDDDQMSMDCDDSLGILTPNQMKDFTLLVDNNTHPTTCSDIRGINFPSSESFDDINDLPEDEQVHDVTVHYLPGTSPATLSLEVAKQSAFQKTKVNGTEFARDDSLSMVSSTDKFLTSVSSKDYIAEAHLVNARSEATLDETVSGYEQSGHNNLSMTNILKSSLTKEIEMELTTKFNLDTNDFDSSVVEKAKPNVSNFSVPSTEAIKKRSVFSELSSLLQSSKKLEMRPAKEKCVRTFSDTQNLIDNHKLTLIAMEEDKSQKNNCDTDSSHDSLLHIDQEHIASKEKLTVSWEDCVTHRDGCIQIERPESVYTVASSDTGYQEEEYGEFEGDAAVMATSMDSTEDSKRFSTASRDSCIVTEDADGYKIAESNSTSGYSTGLSDSCCNDRHDDDSASGKPLTDESIQDSVGPCDSEDAFSLHESSEVAKDIAVEMSDLTDTTETAVFVDSTSDALCETMVQDSTLTDLHELLMSPDDNEATVTSPKDKTFNVDEDEVKNHDQTFVVDEEEPVPVNSPPATCKSTPEKKMSNTASVTNSTNNRSKSSARIERNQRASLQANNAANKAKKMDEQADRKKQIVKSPKRNVMSKIKAMIEATSCKTVTKNKPETEAAPPKRVASTPKRSRWDAVTSKIAASLAEEKTKPKVKRDIKSKVDTNLSLARQQVTCRSPRLDSPRLSIREGSMSPTSVSSRDKRALEHRNSAPCSERDDRSKEKEGQKSPRHLQRLLSLMAGCAPVCRMTYVIPTPPGPGKASRSTSPVAASESSTNSVSLHSHNSKSKIALWKGSSSTVGSAAVAAAAVAPVAKKAATTAPPRFKPPLQTAKTIPPSKMVTKKAPATAKTRTLLTVPNSGGARGRPVSPSGGSSTKADSTRVSNQKAKQGKGTFFGCVL